MELGQKLAKTIVERTMPIIGNNINVMDCKGIIMASGDPARIGETHDGAILALQHGGTIEVTKASCETLKGVLPGINLVLHVDGKVIGVVGVTGEPDVIRTFANLVKMTAEMMVEQADFHEETQWDRRYHEEFIAAWLNETIEPKDFQQRASRLRVDTEVSRVAILIEFDLNQAPPTSSIMRYVVQLFEKSSSENLIAVLSTYEVVVLKAIKQVKGKWHSEREVNKIKQQIKYLNDAGISGFKAVLGFYHQDIKVSFNSTKRLLAIGKQQHPKRVLYLYPEYRIPLLLSPLRDNWQGAQLKQAFNLLKSADKNGSLIKTLQVLFEHHGRISDCAEALCIHRNTLKYRLSRIEDISGLSTGNFAGLFELYIGYVLTEQKS